MSVSTDDGTRAPRSEMYRLEQGAKRCIREALEASDGSAFLAYSGGKDAMVAAHLAAQQGVTDGVCEISFVFPRQVSDARRIASDMGLAVDFRESLGLDWLRRNEQVIFSTDTKVRSWSFSVRQQATVKRYRREHGKACTIFGRRLQENCVPSTLYSTAHGLQCHPLRAWRLHHVWTYIARNRLEVPWIYGTEFGRMEGNAPFYSLDPRAVGGVQAAWREVEKLEPTFTRKALLGY